MRGLVGVRWGQGMQRGEIYWLPFGEPCQKLDEETGAPILGEAGNVVLETKKRPVIVVSRDNLNQGNYVVVVPCYSQDVDRRARFPNNVVLEKGEGGLTKRCVCRTDQITYIDKKLIDWAHDKLGRLTSNRMDEIVKAIRWVIRDSELSD